MFRFLLRSITLNGTDGELELRESEVLRIFILRWQIRPVRYHKTILSDSSDYVIDTCPETTSYIKIKKTHLWILTLRILCTIQSIYTEIFFDCVPRGFTDILKRKGNCHILSRDVGSVVYHTIHKTLESVRPLVTID